MTAARDRGWNSPWIRSATSVPSGGKSSRFDKSLERNMARLTIDSADGEGGFDRPSPGMRVHGGVSFQWPGQSQTFKKIASRRWGGGVGFLPQGARCRG